MTQWVSVNIQEGIATLILQRAEKRNAMDVAVIDQLQQALQQVATNHLVRVVILKSDGVHFCAGADMTWMKAIANLSDENRLKQTQKLAGLLYTMHTLVKPVIVLTQGNALGGGVGLVAAADIVISASDASFCFSEVKIGLVPSVISPYVITAIGERAARYYFLTAKAFNAETAKHLGLVHEIVDFKDLNHAGVVMAKQLIQHHDAALSEVKTLTRSMAKVMITSELSVQTAQHLADRLKTEAASEGLQAFLDKRAPLWSVKS